MMVSMSAVSCVGFYSWCHLSTWGFIDRQTWVIVSRPPCDGGYSHPSCLNMAASRTSVYFLNN